MAHTEITTGQVDARRTDSDIADCRTGSSGPYGSGAFQAERGFATSEVIDERIADTLKRALALLDRVDEVHRLGSDRVRRLTN